MNALVAAILGSVVRHALSGLGVWLVTKGYADSSAATELVGALSTVFAGGWAIVRHVRES